MAPRAVEGKPDIALLGLDGEEAVVVAVGKAP